MRRIAILCAVLAALHVAACSYGEDTPPRPDAPLAATHGATADASPAIVWAPIAHQRSDVIAITLDQVRQVLTGRITDWSQLGGSAAPLHAYVERRDLEPLAAAMNESAGAIHATLLDGPVVDQVAADPGAFGIARVQSLRLSVLALIVDGVDPYRDPAREAPIRTAGVAPDFDPILLASPGELLPVRCTNAALEQHGDFSVIFEAIRPLLRQADISVIALDPALTDLSPPTPCVSTFTLQGSTRSIPHIAEAGIDVVFTNGNHIMDCWNDCGSANALLDTLRALREAGLQTAGAGKDATEARAPAIVEVDTTGDRIRFAFLAYDEIAPWNFATESSPGTAALTAANLRADITAARSRADVVVVATSWGVEYESEPTASQRALANAAFEAGATLVIGNHPHTVQAVEGQDDRLVTYALGNFLFDQSWSVPTQESVFLEASFIGTKLIGFRLRPMRTLDLPGQRRGLYRPSLLDAAGEGRSIMQRIWAASDSLLPLR